MAKDNLIIVCPLCKARNKLSLNYYIQTIKQSTHILCHRCRMFAPVWNWIIPEEEQRKIHRREKHD